MSSGLLRLQSGEFFFSGLELNFAGQQHPGPTLLIPVLHHYVRICLNISSHQLHPARRIYWLHLQPQYPSLQYPVNPSAPPLLLPPSAPPENHHPDGSTGLPRPTGSTLVRHRPGCTFGSFWLHLLPGSAFVLSPTSFASVFRLPGYTLDACRRGSTLVSTARNVVWALRLICFTWVSISSGYISIDHPQGVVCQVNTMAPSSLDSALASSWLVSAPISGSSCSWLPLGSSHPPLPHGLMCWTLFFGPLQFLVLLQSPHPLSSVGLFTRMHHFGRGRPVTVMFCLI